MAAQEVRPEKIGQQKDPEDQSISGGSMDQEVMTVGTSNNDSPSRSVTSGHIPFLLTKARFGRSPALSAKTPAADIDPGDSDDDEEGFLITELKGQSLSVPGDVKTAEGNQFYRIPPRAQSAPAYSDTTENDDYDTDLDNEDSQEDHDPTGRTAYVRMCEKLGVVPVNYFLRHIDSNELTMRYHGLGPLGTKAIARVLRENFSLQKVNLSGNCMQAQGALAMAKMLKENDYITDLTLADNNLESEGTFHITRMLLTNTALHRLDLSGNGIGDNDVQYIAEAIEQNKHLRELVLSRNVLGEAAGKIIGPVIGANETMYHLDMSWNQLRRSGAVSVARGLQENVRLKVCNLSWNGLGPEGGAAIAQAIEINETLQCLDISGNRLGGQCALLIAKALRFNEELKTLKMGNNPITTGGAVAIVTAINVNESSSLEHLDLTDIPVEYKFLHTVVEIRQRRPFKVCQGPVMRSGNTQEDIGKPAVDPFKNMDPLLILREHIVVNDLRILDILKRYDEHQTFSISQQDFAAVLEELGVPHNKDQLKDIAKRMGLNAEGNLYYGDFIKEFAKTDSGETGQITNGTEENGLPHGELVQHRSNGTKAAGESSGQGQHPSRSDIADLTEEGSTNKAVYSEPINGSALSNMTRKYSSSSLYSQPEIPVKL